MHVQDFTIGPVQQGHPVLAVVFLGIGLTQILTHAIDQGPGLITALAAFLGAAATGLPAVTAFLDRRQVRRHAEERFRSRQGSGK